MEIGQPLHRLGFIEDLRASFFDENAIGVIRGFVSDTPANNETPSEPRNAAATMRVSPKTLRVEFEGEIQSDDRYLGLTLEQKYRLDALLGKGGMGRVYLSTHLGTGRTVAVKLISPEFMGSSALVERFRREARAAGRLRHPNVVDVTDFGIATANGEQIAYLAMEYLDGCSLADILGEERHLPLAWVVDVIEQICAAVHAAHVRGIVHRDLKPANIWLEPNVQGGYRVKVLDFGIAKLTDETESDAANLEKSKTTSTESHSTSAVSQEALTQHGVVLGTPAYMSPEQCRGEKADARSDIYSIGVIAYEMLSGAPPFMGDGRSILHAHQNTVPMDLKERNGKLPKAVSDLIMAALAKDPAKRPATARTFAQVLNGSANGLGVLYRRAFALYSEYFPQILQLSLLVHLPLIAIAALTIGLKTFGLLPKSPGFSAELLLGLLKSAATFLTGSIISGVITILVTRLAITPLRPLKVSSALRLLLRSWRPFFTTGFIASALIFVGSALLVIPGLVMTVRYSLWAPVVLTEGLKNRAALRRSRQLAARSKKTVVVAALFQFGFPALISEMIRRFVFLDSTTKPFASAVASELGVLSSVFVLPLLSIVVALVFLKLRQLGGEDLENLQPRVADDVSERKWEKRMIAAETPKRELQQPAI